MCHVIYIDMMSALGPIYLLLFVILFMVILGNSQNQLMTLLAMFAILVTVYNLAKQDDVTEIFNFDVNMSPPSNDPPEFTPIEEGGMTPIDYSNYEYAVDHGNSAATSAPVDAMQESTMGDEQMVSQGIVRNDPKRPIKGSMNKIQMLTPYMGEELAHEENREWFGRSENQGYAATPAAYEMWNIFLTRICKKQMSS